MPQIIDNIDLELGAVLRQALALSDRADCCVGYFNLRGWRAVTDQIDEFQGGPDNQCRLLVGMPTSDRRELRQLLSTGPDDLPPANKTLIERRSQMVRAFKEQLTIGIPNRSDEVALRRLAAQLRERKVVTKLFLAYPLHAKLYLCFRQDPMAPAIGFVGSSNLTMAGLSKQGELNVDVLEQDAARKLARWFEDKWEDRCAIDISDELAKIIEESWAREVQPPPYYLYLKIAYHLSQEARAGEAGYSLPAKFQKQLLPFQEQAVTIAAQHLGHRGIVLLADVVGLGKTIMASALVKIYEDLGYNTLIICPKHLESMWKEYRRKYSLDAEIMRLSLVPKQLSTIGSYDIVLIDESHNLRSLETQAHRALRDYLSKPGRKLVLLSATPYNKSYSDLVGQLGLKLAMDDPLPVKPEHYLRSMTDQERALRSSQAIDNSLAVFRHSNYAEDWQSLLQRFMVRRTRSFIKHNHATLGDDGRYYLVLKDGKRLALPEREPKTLKFNVADDDPNDQYARLFSDKVADTLRGLHLSRYGMGEYLDEDLIKTLTSDQKKITEDLRRARRRLIGFCRTNLFKRLESSGFSFLLSLRRHLLRNHLFLHALENKLDLPIGALGGSEMDSMLLDEESGITFTIEFFDDGEEPIITQPEENLGDAHNLPKLAAELYEAYRRQNSKRYKWLPSHVFRAEVLEHLREDTQRLQKIVDAAGPWLPAEDEKLRRLLKLLKKHAGQKVLVFTQFSDTAAYLETQLKQRGIDRLAAVTGQTSELSKLVQRFSPFSNGVEIPESAQLDVLISTDVLSEGQNLQDCSIVVNFDLPWTLIRLIQRAGRVDRIAQQAPTILCYTFLPADGVERIIRLRSKVRERLKNNNEVIGSDEQFGIEEKENNALRDLYTGKHGILDPDEDDEQVDLSSRAWQIWRQAIDADPKLADIIPALPDVVYSTKANPSSDGEPDGAIVYVKTADGLDALAYVDEQGQAVTDAPGRVLKLAECEPDAPAVERLTNHLELVANGTELLVSVAGSQSGKLGPANHPRHKLFKLLEKLIGRGQTMLFGIEMGELRQVLQAVHDYPLQSDAIEVFRRQFNLKVPEQNLAELAVSRWRGGGLVIERHEASEGEPRIICSLGLNSRGKS